VSVLGLGIGRCPAGEAEEPRDIRYGLTQNQWDRYETVARSAATNALIRKRFSKRLPPGLTLAAGAKTSGLTDSVDGWQPPNEVEIAVPIVPITAGTNRNTHVVVKFKHPSGEIAGIQLALIIR
jgi:hypothetical protein